MISNIIKEVVLNINISSREEAFGIIAEKAVEKGITNERSTVLVDLKMREEQGTTGMIDGFAIPHAKSPAINKPGLVILKSSMGIDWNSMDGKDVNFIFGILIPEKEQGTSHLKILSNIARMLMKEEAKTQLKSAESEKEITKIIEKFISE